VHALDRLRIAERLAAQRPFHAPPLNVCLQVNLAQERTKGGVTPAELPALAAAVGGPAAPRAARPDVHSTGGERAGAPARPWFASCAELLDRLNTAGARLDTRRMGMSGDFEAAIAKARPSCASGRRCLAQDPYNSGRMTTSASPY